MLEDKSLNIPEKAFVEFGIQNFSVAQKHVEYLKKKEHGDFFGMIESGKKGFEKSLLEAYQLATQGEKRFICKL